ncbi:MAG TPA: M15 family metallopeptidase [Syntrophomonadaceae bacterium]|nr:M15 family metallopeptidase [Syntrophomonadaceae bacterium]
MKKKVLRSLILIVLVSITSMVSLNAIHAKAKPTLDSSNVHTQDSSEALQNPIKEPTGEQTNLNSFTGETSPNVQDKEVYPDNTGIERSDEGTGPSAVNKSQTAIIEDSSAPVSRSTDLNNAYPKLSKSQGAFGQFHYKEADGGRIQIDPQWIAENIVTITLPGLNRQVQVNKAAKDNFIKAFTYIKNGTAVINGKEVPLLSLIKTMDGTFVTRHVNWNPANGLSNHSWGTAIDINANNHFRYVDPALEPNDPNGILWEKAFKPAGFSWGNSYSDSMHFELLK